MIADHPERREGGSPLWLWVPAWFLGPALLGIVSINFLLREPYLDLIVCPDTTMEMTRFLVGLAICLTPAGLIALGGLIARVKWLRPSALALGFGLAILLLAVVLETLAPRITVPDGGICKLYGSIEGTPIA